MQAHLASVLKGVVKDKSKGALSRLLGERAAASRLLERIEDGATWHARIGIVLVDDARLRSYTPRAAVEWALRYETDLGLECTRGGTWFSQQPGSKLVDAEAYVSRTALLDRDAAPGEGPWSRAPDDRKVMATAGETRHLLRAKAEGWTTADFKGTRRCSRKMCCRATRWPRALGVDVGPDAILASLGAYRDLRPADVMIQDAAVGSGDDRGLRRARIMAPPAGLYPLGRCPACKPNFWRPSPDAAQHSMAQIASHLRRIARQRRAARHVQHLRPRLRAPAGHCRRVTPSLPLQHPATAT